MKTLSLLTAAAAFLLTGSSRAQSQSFPVLAVTEQNESLTVKWNGEALDGAIINRLEGPQEAWHVTLPPGYVLDAGTYIVPEPVGEDGINRIEVDDLPFTPFDTQVIIVGANGFTWTSDVAGTTENLNPLLVEDAGVVGGGEIFETAFISVFQPFDLVLEDKADAPDAGSTFTLAGLALVGLRTLRRRWTK
jgi:hypothetical protein